MADVMTTIGMRDTDVVSTLTRLETFINGFREKIEKNPIRMRMEAGPGSRLAGYDNPLYASVFKNPQMVEAMEAKFGGGAGGGTGGFSDKLRSGYSTASWALKAGLEVVNTVDRISAAARQQQEWQKSVKATTDEYLRMANEIGRAKTKLGEVKDSVLKQTFASNDSLAKSTLESLGDNKNAANRGWDFVKVNTAWLLGKIPGVMGGYSMGSGLTYDQEQAATAAFAEQQMNKTARGGTDAAKRALEEARKKDIEEGAAKFVEEGRTLNSRAEAAQNEREQREKIAAANKKAREEATRGFEIDQMSELAIIRRLQNREKEAKLLEARADYLRRNASLDQNESLTSAQKSQGQWRSFGIYEGMLKAINDGEEKARIIRGFDYSAGGGSQTLMAALGGSDRMQRSLDNIDKNTAAMAGRTPNASAINIAIQQASRAVWN